MQAVQESVFSLDLFFLAVLGIEVRPLHVLGKRSAPGAAPALLLSLEQSYFSWAQQNFRGGLHLFCLGSDF